MDWMCGILKGMCTLINYSNLNNYFEFKLDCAIEKVLFESSISLASWSHLIALANRILWRDTKISDSLNDLYSWILWEKQPMDNQQLSGGEPLRLETLFFGVSEYHYNPTRSNMFYLLWNRNGTVRSLSFLKIEILFVRNLSQSSLTSKSKRKTTKIIWTFF